jgi:hypothetical protein
MSSVSRAPQNTSQGDAYYVNITNLVPNYHVLDACGNSVVVAGVDYGTTYAPGALFLRDMGKTIRVPGQTLDAVWRGPRVLRKVQIVGQSNINNFPVTNGFINVNEGVSGSADALRGPLPTGYATFYIDLADNGPAVYGDAPRVRFARLSI